MTERTGIPTGDANGTVVAPPRTIGWTPPPLPGGPVVTTPGGDHTIRSGGGLTSAALVGPACRVPILFGRCRISPDIVSVQASNYRAEFLCVISEGPIDAVEDWLTDTAETFDALTVTLGTLATPAPTLQGTVGLAAAYIRTRAGKPYQPRCIARGMLLYDPRLGTWGAGEYPDPTKCVYSTNPALMKAYLLLFPQFGWGRPGVTPSLVDWSSVEAAADMCDELVGGEKRYEVNLHLQQGEDASLWAETIGLHAGLRWTEAGGLWRLDYSAPVATVAATITDDHIVKGTEPRLSYGSGAGLADRPNVFTAEWIDPASDWQVRTVEIRHPSVDAGEPKRAASVYKFHGFHSEAMCLRALWRVACDIWSEQDLDAVLTAEMLHLVDGSRVTVSLPSLGLAGVDFLVTGTSYDQDQVRITARRYDADTWTAPGSTSGVLPGSGFFDVPGNLTSVARISLESNAPATVRVTTTTQNFLGFSWQLPAFEWAKEVLIRVWPAGTSPTWDTAGYTEFTAAPQGDGRFASDPTWKASLKPYVWRTTVATFDKLGHQTGTATTGPGFDAILRLRSLAGQLSTGVAISEAAHSSSTSTPSTEDPLTVDTAEAPVAGGLPVWDSGTGKLTFPAPLAWDDTKQALGTPELRSGTLASAGLAVTVGGRILVGQRTKLALEMQEGDSTITVEHNTLSSGDVLYLETLLPGGIPIVEYVGVTSGASGAGPYAYSVTRTLDGAGAEYWPAGAAVFNMGAAGEGFIDIYSAHGVKAATEVGPAIVGNVRASGTWNDWSPRWAVGNLKGIYGYAADTYGAAFGVPSGPWLKIDATNGIRIGHNATTKIQLDSSGNATFSGAVTAASGTIGGWTIGTDSLSATGIVLKSDAIAGPVKIYIGAGNYGNADTAFYVDGDSQFSLGAKLTWDGTDLTVRGGNVTLDADGISIPAGGLTAANAYGFTNGAAHAGGLYCDGDDIYVGCPTGYPKLIFDKSAGESGFYSSFVYCGAGFTTRPGVAVASGFFDSAAGYKKDGTQVVGTQGAAVANATDAASVIARLNDLLARLRTHGLIAT